MQLLSKIQDIRDAVRIQRKEGKTIGFVPTMGALHKGHADLIRRAVEKCDFVVVDRKSVV